MPEGTRLQRHHGRPKAWHCRSTCAATQRDRYPTECLLLDLSAAWGGLVYSNRVAHITDLRLE